MKLFNKLYNKLNSLSTDSLITILFFAILFVALSVGEIGSKGSIKEWFYGTVDIPKSIINKDNKEAPLIIESNTLK
ncbi:hypothetical protein [Poseidonibacter ostreae]|uniref:Uncharacterized protein n=1 Tax=Poseidonibacter ostreae TaxID=2654171 RepID=A0A6L4WWT4_9BACT|nr:hypothetical protein [Poseidonibacter ostreae]KAB7891398.1 hypothetical protein GBG19_00750 [Poseidonibacter ostreae]